MRRTGLGAVVVVGLLLAGQQAALAHDWTRDDTCGTSTYDAYFYPMGRASDWYAPSNSAAIGGCYMYTNAQTGGSMEAAIWYLPTDANFNHTYQVRVHIPSNWGCTGNPVRYERWANGTAGGVTSNHTLNQNGVASPAWRTIMTQSFTATSGGYVKMVDNTGITTQKVCADQLRYITQ